MKIAGRATAAPEVLIAAGCCLFIFALWYSAYLDPTIRWLHFFQAWMYLLPLWLARRRNRWGYFIGISAAAFWEYIAAFVSTFLRSGLHWLSASFAAGRVLHPDQLIALPAFAGNLLVIAGSLWAYTRLKEKRRSDLARFALAFVLTTGFLAAAIAVCQPRYLGLFRGMLHPHPF